MAIQSPRGLCIVEAGTRASDRHLIPVLALHGLIEVSKILFAPVASISGPPFLPRVDPRIETIEGRGIRARQVFVNQEWRNTPFVHRSAHLVPVRMESFGKDKDHRPALDRKRTTLNSSHR